MRGNVRHHQISGIMVASLVAVTFCCGFVLSSSSVSGDDSYDADVSLTIPVACTMTGTLNTPHTANVEAGTYVADIGTTTLKTVCNDGNGFSIYAIGYSGLEYGNNKMLATVGGTLAPTYDITTGTATSGETSNWAMKLNAVSGTYAPTLTNGFGSYRTVPNEYTKAATFLSSTDATVGSSIQSTYAVYVKSLQPAGTYDGKVKYTLVHPNTETPPQPVDCVTGKICYNANGGNVEGTMGQQDASGNTETMLLASNFSREGYGFAGWSDVFDYDTNPNAHFYGPQETITTPADMSAGLPLYAVWIKSTGSIQDPNTVSSLCGTGTGSLVAAITDNIISFSSVSALTDQRDGETYAIAKLADGKCWMIENLRLGNNNSSNYSGSLAQGYGTSATDGNFSGLADSESYWSPTDTVTANSLYYSGTQEGTASINIGTANVPAYRMPRYNNLNIANRAVDPTSNSFENDDITGGMYSYGNYYTWHAAIADLAYNHTNNQSTIGTSLCPTGWRLPQGGDKTRIVNNDDNDFWNLVVDALNGGINPINYTSSTTPYYNGSSEASPISNKLRTYPNNFLYSGYYEISGAYFRGSIGFYWSSTAGSLPESYYMRLNGLSTVHPGTQKSVKMLALSIRCIFGS